MKKVWFVTAELQSKTPSCLLVVSDNEEDAKAKFMASYDHTTKELALDRTSEPKLTAGSVTDHFIAVARELGMEFTTPVDARN